MKKSKILAAVLLLAMFSSVFTVGTVTLPAQTGSASAPVTESEIFTPDAMGDPMGNKGILADNATGHSFTADGDLADWVGMSFEMFGGVNVSLAFDATNVYIALQWKDTTYDVSVGQWNKTGMLNDTLVDWQFVNGADDVVQVGFSQGAYTDLMVWTTSTRTNDVYAFECNASGQADLGVLPYLMNTNVTGTFDGAKPTLQNDFATPITNEVTDANGTMYHAWYNTTTPSTLGQTDTDVSADWNSTLMDHYTVEMTRALDTGDATDFALNFSEAMTFHVGAASQDNTYDMLISTSSYSVALTNDAAALTFTTITGAVQNDALVITGGVFDDFSDYTLTIQLTGWADTYGPGAWFAPDVNAVTGNYSFLFFFDEWDMPLGTHTIFVTLYTMYEAPIQLNQTIVIDDTKAPTIQGIVDMQERYPTGVPLDEDYVIVTVGLDDDYCHNNDISAFLYSWVDDNVANPTDMVQFAPGSTTFTANITILHTVGVVSNYTFFIQVWDTNYNKFTTQHYWFLDGNPTETVPAFGIIAGLFGLAASAFIIKKIKK